VIVGQAKDWQAGFLTFASAALAWGFYILASPRRAGVGLTVVGSLWIAANAVELTRYARRAPRVLPALLVLAWLFSSLIAVFSYLYWSNGGGANFTCGGASPICSLTKSEAVYVAIGTLSTAGTGTIAPVSGTARAVQTVQMMLDLSLVAFTLAAVLARYVNRDVPAVSNQDSASNASRD
jgi:hypothetical protein